MTKAIEFTEAFGIAWRSHVVATNAAFTAEDEEAYRLLEARRMVAERYPGCARAILSRDPISNWDRGQLVQQTLAHIPRA